jgi:proton-translocating NADH-quinone oxidoreductase chain N
MPITAIEAIVDSLGFTLIGVGLVVPTIDYVLKVKVSKYASLAATAIAIVLSAVLLSLTLSQAPLNIYNNALKIDSYGAFLFLIVSVVSFLITFASFRQTKGWTTAPSFFSLLLIITAGVYYLISVNDLVLLIAAWALISVAAYALVAIKKDKASLEGASKYALMGVTASVFLLFGVFILIGLTGTTTDMTTMAQTATAANLPLTLIAVIMIIVGIGFKIGIVPFHGWLPDVYGGVNPITISFVSTILKVSGILALFRILYPFAAALGDKWLILFSILSIVTMTFGNIAALIQRNVQKMMAYSSIAQVGYILVGFAAATSSAGAAIGVQGIALHLTMYVLATSGIFIALAYLTQKGMQTDLNGIGGLWRKMPIISIGITILLLSLIGMPPLLGFWSKFLYLFISPIQIAPWLTLVAIINTGISVGYYGQIIRSIFLAGPQSEGLSVKESLKDPEAIVIIIAASLTIILGLGLATIIAPALGI